MFVSVIVCTHQAGAYQNVLDAVASLLDQTYKKLEIIIVVDGNETLCGEIKAAYDIRGNIHIIGVEESIGVSGARDLGIGAAKGDVIAFLDDDAVAGRRWIEGLVDTYRKNDAIAVGGRVLPVWLPKKPEHLPEELYWLVGATHEGFAREGVSEVRNTFGPNMSFKREVFEKVGLFNRGFGFARRGTSYIQGEEAEFALRMRHKLGKGVIYNPELIVYHKVPASKARLGILFKRSFYQGYTKALLRRLSPCPKPLATEESYLKDLLFKYIPRRARRILSGSGSLAEIKQLLVLLASIFAVGLGFIYGHIKRPSGYPRTSAKVAS